MPDRGPGGGTRLRGILTVPMGAVGLVVLVASALSTASPLNRAMAAYFDRDGLATLLVDLVDLVGPREAVLPGPAEWLRWISAPTMFLAGGWDAQVLEANRCARKSLRCESAVEIISCAGQNLDESTVRARIAELSITWLLHGLQPLAAAQ